MSWPPLKKDKNKEVVLCPKCHQPGGVQLFTSISPCDACLNPDEFKTPAFEDTDPFGVLPPGTIPLGHILSVTNSSYGPMAVALILPSGTIWPNSSGYKLTTLSMFPNHAPLVACSQLPDYSWAIHVAGVSSILSKITVGAILYVIP